MTSQKQDSTNSYFMNNAKSCIYYAMTKVVLEQKINKIFVPSYGCADIYASISLFDVSIGVYDELDGERLFEIANESADEGCLILVVDLLHDNQELVSQLNGITNCYVIYDRTNNEISENCIADFDVYSLGVAKRNGIGGGALLMCNSELTSEYLSNFMKFKIGVKYIIGAILMSAIFYRITRYIRKILTSVVDRRSGSIKAKVTSFKPCSKIWKCDLDIHAAMSLSPYVANKNQYKNRIEIELVKAGITPYIFGVARLVIMIASEHEENALVILKDLGFKPEVSDYINIVKSEQDYEFGYSYSDKHIYFIG